MISRILNKIKRIKFKIDRFDLIAKTKIPISTDMISIGNPLASWVIPKESLSEESICYLVGAD